MTRPRPAVRCPTCGHTWPVAPPVDDARRLAHQAALRKAMERRAAVDQVTVWPKVPELFTARQVGEGCRAAGRHWSEHQAVIGRADRLGLIVRVARVKLASQRDTQLWRQTPALMKVHKLALKVKRTNEKGLTARRR